jgi:hemoglobin
VDPDVRERFALFLVGWLGGPQTYMELHGHPRLRMRHAKVPINEAMRDAWLRSMERALDARGVQGEVRDFLDARFADVANFLRNTEG